MESRWRTSMSYDPWLVMISGALGVLKMTG
jgi:hypothetical protein